MTPDDLARDWKALLDAAALELDRCETALRIVLPFFRERITLAEMDELELAVRLLHTLRRKFSARFQFYKIDL